MRTAISVWVYLWVATISICSASATVVENTLEDGAVLSLAQGKLVLKNGDKELDSIDFEAIEALAVMKVHTLDVGVQAFEISWTGDEIYRVVGIRQKDRLKVVWQGAVVYRGDLGEQMATDVRIEDIDGDGKKEIVKGTLYEGVQLCGHKDAPLLFRSVFDMKKKKFVYRPLPRSVLSTTSLPVAESFVPNNALHWSFLSASGVSSCSGDDQNPLLLTPPWALVDDRTETGWISGNANGDGEFVSFSTISSHWKITAIGIEVAEVFKARKADRFSIPSSLLLLTETEQFRLALQGKPGKQWFVLPKPISTSCLSLILEAGENNWDPMALFEVSVQTELHRAGGLDMLVKSLDDSKRGEEALRVLRSVPKGVLEAVKRNWKALSIDGKRRAVRWLVEMAPVEGSHLIVSVAVTHSKYIEEDILRGMLSSKGRAEKVLGKYLTNKSNLKFEQAIEWLKKVGTTTAFEVLVEAASTRDSDRQKTIIEAVAKVAGLNKSYLQPLVEKAAFAREKGDTTSMFVWLDIVSRQSNDEKQLEQTALIARQVYEESEFENQYRALRIIAHSKTEFAIPFVVQESTSKNRHLRQMIASTLGNFPSSRDALETLLRLAQDKEPAVQMEAFTALEKWHSPTKKPVILVALSSPWPTVRALAVSNAGDVPSIYQRVVLKGLKDKHYRVVFEALQMATKLNDSKISAQVTRLLVSAKNAIVLEQAAKTSGARCQKDEQTLKALFALLQIGSEPLANSTEKIIAVAAANALGRIGSMQAVAYLKEARKRSNLATDKAIDSAIASSSSSCAKQITP